MSANAFVNIFALTKPTITLYLVLSDLSLVLSDSCLVLSDLCLISSDLSLVLTGWSRPAQT